jgi:hypothetical protein
MFSKAQTGYANGMNPPVRDAKPLAAPLVTQADAASADARDFWDALWTLDEDWHPDPTRFGGGPGLPDFLTIL